MTQKGEHMFKEESKNNNLAKDYYTEIFPSLSQSQCVHNSDKKSMQNISNNKNQSCWSQIVSKGLDSKTTQASNKVNISQKEVPKASETKISNDKNSKKLSPVQLGLLSYEKIARETIEKKILIQKEEKKAEQEAIRIREWYKYMETDTVEKQVQKLKIEKYYNILQLDTKNFTDPISYIQKAEEEIEAFDSRPNYGHKYNYDLDYDTREEYREYLRNIELIKRFESFPTWLDKCWDYEYIMDDDVWSYHGYFSKITNVKDYINLSVECKIKYDESYSIIKKYNLSFSYYDSCSYLIRREMIKYINNINNINDIDDINDVGELIDKKNIVFFLQNEFWIRELLSYVDIDIGFFRLSDFV